MIGNFKCDKICNTTEFEFDGGDCKFEPTEVVTCKDEWLGDGICDTICNNEKFDFDKGDCKQPCD